jgi:hypothetical protein
LRWGGRVSLQDGDELPARSVEDLRALTRRLDERG